MFEQQIEAMYSLHRLFGVVVHQVVIYTYLPRKVGIMNEKKFLSLIQKQKQMGSKTPEMVCP